jgi:chromosome segregation ATPase
MKSSIQIVGMAGAIACVLAISMLGTGCTESKDVATKALRAEADDLTNRLTSTERALNASEGQNAQLQTSNQQLLEQLATLERERKQELEKLQTLRDGDLSAANKRVRGLNAQIDALNRDILEKDASNLQKDAALVEQTRSINQLNSSIDAHRKQLAALEKERTALAEELRSAKKSRNKTAVIMGLVFVGCITAGFMTKWGRARQSSEPEPLPRVQTAMGSRRAS